MSNIIRFRKPPYVELNGGILSRGPNAGQPIYILDYIDEDGCRLGIWDGGSYDEACQAANEWRQDGVHVVDLLREAL